MWRSAALVIAIALSGCSSGQAPSSKLATPATTPTTSTTTAALDAAKEACFWGDTSTSQGSYQQMRTIIRLHGEDPSLLSDGAVFDRFKQLANQLGPKAFGDLQSRAVQSNYETATAAAAKAAALDPRWEQLLHGMSDYTAYLVNHSNPTSDQTSAWFEEIRLGCQKVRALTGP